MKRNLIFLSLTVIASIAGVFLPGVAGPLWWTPTVSMLVQLLFCFLSTADPSTPLPSKALRSLPKFLAIKMILVPLVCWGVVRLVFPDYALGALLVAGASIGVMAPFFAYLCGAEPFFVIGGVICSSLVMPITIPSLSALVLSFDGRSVEGLVQACLGSAIFLAFCMLIPFGASKILWTRFPAWAQGLMDRRFGITLVCVTTVNLVIFSRFSKPLLNNLSAVADAMLAGLMVTAMLIGMGLWAARTLPLPEALSRLIGISCVNCALMLIVAAEFFSLPEMLVCALYSLPLMSMGVPYEICRRWLARREKL